MIHQYVEKTLINRILQWVNLKGKWVNLSLKDTK